MYLIKQHWLKIILVFYAFLHLAQLEVFPFYHFAMYSQRIMPDESFTIYEIKSGDQVINIKDFNYRRYVYLTNTLKAYESMINNGNCNPSSEIIHKYYDILGLKSTSRNMTEKDYCCEDIQVKMKIWLQNYLKTSHNLAVYKKQYNWPVNGQPEFVLQELLL